jgi:hypothetical protein
MGACDKNTILGSNLASAVVEVCFVSIILQIHVVFCKYWHSSNEGVGSSPTFVKTPSQASRGNAAIMFRKITLVRYGTMK